MEPALNGVKKRRK